jgi:peptidoglycan/xylan/chitin deacetylase (PgdA/CDA1 family)
LRASVDAAAIPLAFGSAAFAEPVDHPAPARVAITLDLEMSREYPRPEDTHWDYEKGNLDAATKAYAVEAARLVESAGGRIQFFALGRTMEQPDVEWLRGIAAAGHPIGNHTYDHVNVHATRAEDLQHRFRRAPWLIEGKSCETVIRENIAMSRKALESRLGIRVSGFRTPGGSYEGLRARPDLQKLILDLGYRWVSSLYPSHASAKRGEPITDAVLDAIAAAQTRAQPFVYESGLVEVPMSPISDVTAFRAQGWKLDAFLEAVRRSMHRVIADRAVFDFLAHPSCLVHTDPEFRTIRAICEIVRQSEGAAVFSNLEEIARGSIPRG